MSTPPLSTISAPSPDSGLIVIVDPLSTGSLLAEEVVQLNAPHSLVIIWSQPFNDAFSHLAPIDEKHNKRYKHEIIHDGSDHVDALIDKLLQYKQPIIYVGAGCETGVDTAERIIVAILRQLDSKPPSAQLMMNTSKPSEGATSLQYLTTSFFLNLLKCIQETHKSNEVVLPTSHEIPASQHPPIPPSENGLSAVLHNQRPVDWFAQSLTWRRNKYHMNKRLKQSGIRSVKQVLISDLSQVVACLDEYFPLTSPVLNSNDETQVESTGSMYIIVKPVAAGASEDVYLCDRKNVPLIKEKVQAILSKSTNATGISNSHVLLQEYLEGPEFVIDTHSQQGKHKIIAAWKYDKRNIQERHFCYFGMTLLQGKDQTLQVLSEYLYQVLDALLVSEGSSHTELILTKHGPYLVETGKRLHGGEGTWSIITRACIGYSAIDASAQIIVNPSHFDSLPQVYETSKYGAEVFFVHYGKKGKLLGLKPSVLDELLQLSSLHLHGKHSICWYQALGTAVVPTTDCLTLAGSVRLINSDQSMLHKEYQLVQAWNAQGMLSVDYEEDK